jgi:hypothetical protein
MAREGLGRDEDGCRAEMLGLIDKAKLLGGAPGPAKE